MYWVQSLHGELKVSSAFRLLLASREPLCFSFIVMVYVHYLQHVNNHLKAFKQLSLTMRIYQPYKYRQKALTGVLWLMSVHGTQSESDMSCLIIFCTFSFCSLNSFCVSCLCLYRVFFRDQIVAVLTSDLKCITEAECHPPRWMTRSNHSLTYTHTCVDDGIYLQLGYVARVEGNLLVQLFIPGIVTFLRAT